MKLTTLALVAAAAALCAASPAFAYAFEPEQVDRVQAAATAAVAGQTRGQRAPGQRAPRPRREITAEERAMIEAAIPTKAPATPQRPRRLLVFDLNVNYGGHASIPYANLAMQLTGQKTGAFEATVSSDPAMLEASALAQFDAVYLNNTVGDIFATPELRAGFAAYIANGGGLIGNHGTSVASTDWAEFGEILGARGASHREQDEKVVINVEDPSHPVTQVFGGQPFEYADENFRFQAPYSRDKVRVLLSIDPIATNMTQGRCAGQCFRADHDYPIAWIRQHGKGRVFYTTLGHNPHVFWEPRLLEMFLAGIQFAMGDLQADATPRPRDTMREFDAALADLAQYDFGRDQRPVRRLERTIVHAAATPEGTIAVEEKLLKVLQSDVPLGARDAICRQLAIFGSTRAVAVLERMVQNADTAGMARYALHGIQSQLPPR